MRFLEPSHPLLSQKAKPVSEMELRTEKIQQIIDRMVSTAFGEQKDRSKPVMVGLAAPQVGINKRIILVDVAADGTGQTGDLQVFINPEIISQSEDQTEWYEGCYSTGNICGQVNRAKNIKVKALTSSSVTLSEAKSLKAPSVVPQDDKQPWVLMDQTYTGYTARIFQHEIDHLDGIRFPDRIKNEVNLHIVEKHEFPSYRDKQAWRTWKKKANFAMWDRIKMLQNNKCHFSA